MKYLILFFIFTGFLFAQTAQEIREDIKQLPPEIVKSLQSTCEKIKDETSCKMHKCLMGDDKVCMDYHNAAANSEVSKKLDEQINQMVESGDNKKMAEDLIKQAEDACKNGKKNMCELLPSLKESLNSK